MKCKKLQLPSKVYHDDFRYIESVSGINFTTRIQLTLLKKRSFTKTQVGLVSNTKDIDKYTSSLSPSSSALTGLALAAADLPLATFFLAGDGTSSSSESSSSCQMMKHHCKNYCHSLPTMKNQK